MEINGEAQFNRLIGDGKKYLVDFYADWCGPCKIMGRILEGLSASELNGYTILKVNVDENQEISEHHHIMSIPTIFLYKEGKAVDHFVGLKDKKEITDKLSKY